MVCRKYCIVKPMYRLCNNQAPFMHFALSVVIKKQSESTGRLLHLQSINFKCPTTVTCVFHCSNEILFHYAKLCRLKCINCIGITHLTGGVYSTIDPLANFGYRQEGAKKKMESRKKNRKKWEKVRQIKERKVKSNGKSERKRIYLMHFDFRTLAAMSQLTATSCP